MDLQLAGKRALITAGSKGLGRAVAEQLVLEGCHIVICSRNHEHINEAVGFLADRAGDSDAVMGMVADVTKQSDIERLVRAAQAKLGGIDLLVTNTGGPPAGNFDAVTDEMWQEAFELNLLSVVRLIRLVLPTMKSQHFGRILNVSSTSVKQPIDHLILSNTIRTGLMAMLKSLALEVAGDGILVHNLAPGRISTDRVRTLDVARAQREGRSITDVELKEQASIPLGRYGTPEEFGTFAAMLLSPLTSYMTGQTYLVDGGVIRSL